LFSGWSAADGLSTGGSQAEGEGAAIYRLDDCEPAAGWVLWADGEEGRLVAAHGDAESADAVPGGDGRCSRGSADGGLLCVSAKEHGGGSAEQLGAGAVAGQ